VQPQWSTVTARRQQRLLLDLWEALYPLPESVAN
jgi:hypothetical protein